MFESFEAELSDVGTIAVKFWLAIGRDEQEARVKVLKTICERLEESL